MSSFLTENTLLNFKINIKPIRSNGQSSNALKNCNFILKISPRQAQYHFDVSPHEILKSRYFILKSTLKLHKIALNSGSISCTSYRYV